MKNSRILTYMMAAVMAGCLLTGCKNAGGPQAVDVEVTETESVETETAETEIAETETAETETAETETAETETAETETAEAETAVLTSAADADISEDDSSFSFSELSNLEFWFGSGAGAWRTVMTVQSDGAFEGEYADSDMTAGEDYPNGVQYFCSFAGKFTEPVRVNDYTYSVRIERIGFANEPGTEEIKDGIKYIYSDPYGLNNAEEILFYLPGAPVKELPEQYKSWMGGHGGQPIEEELPFYGIYNVNEGQGFSSYEKTEDNSGY